VKKLCNTTHIQRHKEQCNSSNAKQVEWLTETTHTHTCLTALFPGPPGWAGTRKVKTNLDFTEARDNEWQWYQLGHMQVCTSIQTDNHASTPPLSFLQAGCPSCRLTNSIKALTETIMLKMNALFYVIFSDCILAVGLHRPHREIRKLYICCPVC